MTSQLPATQSGSPPETILPSEEIVVSAPMSFHGSGARIWRPLSRAARTADSGWKAAALYALAVVLIAFAWLFVAGWYTIFGLLVVPYRLIRRSQRKGKLNAAQHRELLAAVEAQKREEAQREQR